MSNDPLPMGKPYLAGKQEYFSLYRHQTWEDGDPSGDKQLSEYSEFQKPYLYDEDIPEDYSWWENTWPDFPTIPITAPDPITHPCSADDFCNFAAITGTDSMKCPGVYVFTQLHVWIGCTVAPWWAAFGTWELEPGDPGVILLSSNPVTATIQITDSAGDGTAKLIYYGPGCTATKEIPFTCDACCDFEILGSATVNPGTTWTGTIQPGCVDTTCGVTSNSGCTLSCELKADGTKVYVDVGAADCGTFVVTVTKAAEGNCAEHAVSFAVRINNTGQGGAWNSIAGYDDGPCSNPPCAGGAGTTDYGSTCIDSETGHRYGTGATCGANITYECRGETPTCPVDHNDAPPCVSGELNPCSSGHANFKCTIWKWDECEWVCSC